MRLGFLAAALIALALTAGGAHAATTVYPVSFFSNSGVASPIRLLGNNPSVATFSRNDSVGLNYGTDITKFTISVNVTSVTPNTTYLWIRFGRRNLLSFTNAAGVGLLTPGGAPTQNIYAPIVGPGLYWINSVAYASGCAAIGGCNAIMIGNSSFSAAGSVFGASVVGATPEPSVWALMIVGFAGVAARLKAERGKRAGRPALA